jgi:threonyl-tRNA synthetase
MDDVERKRHSLSHIMAAAVKELYGAVEFGVGPAIENGFYYDMLLGKGAISEADLSKIEGKMREIISKKLPIVSSEKTRAEALKWAKSEKQDFKEELIKEIPDGEKIEFYTIGDFTDLCRGPHVKNTGDVGAFKLTSIAGAYWRGDEKREMMQRIYGAAFPTQKELDEYLARQEEAKARDHRKLGKELDLFTFSDLVGAGLPMFTPRGGMLRNRFEEYSLSLRRKRGFDRVWSPHITKLDLYKKSGHYDKFGKELFLVHSQVNGEEFALKPMNCPHHTQIFACRQRSYKELPIRMMECTTDYRDEKTGELGGLSRVRSISQDDTHVFCRKSQIKEEVGSLVGVVKEFYETVGMNKLRARLSYRDDSDAYLGELPLWEMAQKQIKELAVENGLDFFEAEGEAAFYGPKIDFMAEDAIGREHQVATIQLDFVMPERFGLEYINEAGEKEHPVMVHHATMGSTERFLSVFIEHTAGWLPFWCAPEQIRILTINDSVEGYVSEITGMLDGIVLEEPLKHNEVRYAVDRRNESLGKKIKEATEMKIPMMVVVGPKDAEARMLSVRLRDSEEKVKFDDFAAFVRSSGN